MACIERRYFGLPIVGEQPPDLAEAWGGWRDDPGILIYADRRILRRLVWSRFVRAGLAGKIAAVVPVGRGARGQVRMACGCDTGEHNAFQGPIRILSRAETDNASIFIVDTDPAAVRRIEENLKVTYPGLRIVGRAAFSPAIAASVTTAIRKSGPRIVLVGSTKRSVLTWIISQYDSTGKALALVAEDAVARMAGRPRVFNPLTVPAFPFRLFLIPLYLGHRLILRRRQKISTASGTRIPEAGYPDDA